MKNRLTLQPKDYVVFSAGLKIENTGDQVIILDRSLYYKVEPVSKPGILGISFKDIHHVK